MMYILRDNRTSGLNIILLGRFLLVSTAPTNAVGPQKVTHTATLPRLLQHRSSARPSPNSHPDSGFNANGMRHIYVDHHGDLSEHIMDVDGLCGRWHLLGDRLV
ncbi:hypothetical protein BKA82DRAFT_3601175 [Pisolithus tinctorius]|nr:hypothetical protein BKA82DRAFT_3601175 [Pisolithus tinctorius]